MTWKYVLLRVFVLVYSDYLALSTTPGKSYSPLSNAELEQLTGYPKSLWEVLGKGTSLYCVLDCKSTRKIVNTVRGQRDKDSTFTQADRRAIKKECRKQLQKLIRQGKYSHFFSEFEIIFPNLMTSLHR